MCVCKRRFFFSFLGLFLKVPTGAVQFASCPTDGPSDLQFLTFFPLRAGNTLSAQSINILMPSSSSSLALPWRLARCVYFFARISIRYALDVYVLCTAECQSGNVLERRISPPSPLFRIVFYLLSQQQNWRTCGAITFFFSSWCGGGGDDDNCACAWLFSSRPSIDSMP